MAVLGYCLVVGERMMTEPLMNYLYTSEELRQELKIACKYLREAKLKWSPNTTNSSVDTFLEKWDKRDVDHKQCLQRLLRGLGCGCVDDFMMHGQPCDYEKLGRAYKFHGEK